MGRSGGFNFADAELNRMRCFLQSHLLCQSKGNALQFLYEQDEALDTMNEWADATGKFADNEDEFVIADDSTPAAPDASDV